MSELRNDLVTGHPVLLAPGRSARPHTVAPAPIDPNAIANCPFCPGHEHETPPEVLRRGTGAPDTPGWRIRVVPNLYPIVGGEHAGPGGAGAHEVIIFHPDHAIGFGALADHEVVELFRVLRDRAAVHAADLAHVQVLVNQGRAAGASIAHPHAQVFALDVVPRAVEDAVGRFRTAGIDLVTADVLEDHVVQSVDQVSTWCPPASSSQYLLRLAHELAGERFDRADDPTIDAVAVALRDALRRVRGALGDVPYNVVVHTAPHDARPYHWYVEVTPRLSVIAGFEQATGILVNTVPPDQAAELLREASPR